MLVITISYENKTVSRWGLQDEQAIDEYHLQQTGQPGNRWGTGDQIGTSVWTPLPEIVH
jgi:hypothetical protein